MKISGAPTQTLSPQSLLSSSPSCIPLPSPSTVIPSPKRVYPLLHAVRSSSRFGIQCNSSSSTGGPGPGENDSRQILDAFFLGKAVAEALTERIESTVGEFLSTIGRLQAEQQKQVQEFQEEVFERAKKSKEKAAKEAMEEGFVPTSTSVNATMTTTSPTDSYTVTVVSDTSPVANVNGVVTTEGDEDPFSEVSIDE